MLPLHTVITNKSINAKFFVKIIETVSSCQYPEGINYNKERIIINNINGELRSSIYFIP